VPGAYSWISVADGQFSLWALERYYDLEQLEPGSCHRRHFADIFLKILVGCVSGTALLKFCQVIKTDVDDQRAHLVAEHRCCVTDTLSLGLPIFHTIFDEGAQFSTFTQSRRKGNALNKNECSFWS